jgi:hypothetical protein
MLGLREPQWEATPSFDGLTQAFIDRPESRVVRDARRRTRAKYRRPLSGSSKDARIMDLHESTEVTDPWGFTVLTASRF